MHIAYLINTGIILHEQNASVLRLRLIIDCLRGAGHQVRLLVLQDRHVIAVDDWNLNCNLRLGFSSLPVFNLFESAARRAQGELKLPYFALFDSFRFYEACTRKLRGVDLVYEHCGLFGWGGLAAARKLGLPYLLDVEADLLEELGLWGTPLKGPHGAYAAALYRRTFHAANDIVVVSDVLKRKLVNTWKVNPAVVHVLPNGVDLERFAPTPARQEQKACLGLEGKTTIAFVGGFYPWHGVGSLVRAFALAASQVPELRLLLVGDGPQLQEVKVLVAQENLMKSVVFIGQVSPEQVPDYLSLADVCVAPYEHFPDGIWFSPLKIFEYMAAGKAIVASRTGQISEVIQHGRTGLLIDPGDVAGMAQAITNLAANAVYRETLGENARACAIENHSWKQYSANLECIFRQALASKSSDSMPAGT